MQRSTIQDSLLCSCIKVLLQGNSMNMQPLNVSLPRTQTNGLFSGEAASCPFMNNEKKENESLFVHLSNVYDKGLVTYDTYKTLRNMIICGDVAVIDALYSDIHGNNTLLCNLLQSDYLNRKTDFCYLDHLSPIAECDFFSNDDGLSSFSNTSYSFMLPCIQFQKTNDNASQSDLLSRDSTDDSMNNQQTIPLSDFHHDMSESNDCLYDERRMFATVDLGDTPLYLPSNPSCSLSNNWNDFYKCDNNNYDFFSDSLSSICDTCMLTLTNSTDTSVAIPDSSKPLSSKKCTESVLHKSKNEKKHENRKHKSLSKKCRYDIRKSFADTRLRVKGRFLKKIDEEFLREYVNLT